MLISDVIIKYLGRDWVPCTWDWGKGGGCASTVRSKLNKFEHVGGGVKMVEWDPCRHTQTTENITFPQLRWLAVKVVCLVEP